MTVSPLILRILLYAQLLLGLILFIGLFAGFAAGPPVRDTHLLLGLIIAILAPLAFSPQPAVPESTPRRLARLAPLAPLLVGFGLRFGVLVDLRLFWIVVHVILGLATIGLIEIAAARQRRALTD